MSWGLGPNAEVLTPPYTPLPLSFKVVLSVSPFYLSLRPTVTPKSNAQLGIVETPQVRNVSSLILKRPQRTGPAQQIL